MPLKAGTQLGPYEILSPLGAGGMGEVYLAADSKLDRQVAIKVLPETMTRDKERVARFEREAKLLASLNHPNIAAIYGFDEYDGSRFLVMEYVQGETLGSHLGNGPVAIEDALDIGKQVAEALEAAHGQGVIHRDLKPANVMIRQDGTVKVLDFGLAKAMTEESSSSEIANSPTITANYTRPGVVLGTAAYMSPEQARGRPLDKRTDIWSFGIILFECLTGARLFQGETANDSMGAIMHKDPEWSLLPHGTPPTIQLLLRRCLTKDRKRRLHDIADARIELENALVDPTSTSLGLAQAALDVKRRWLPPWPWVVAFVVALMLAAVGGWFARPKPSKLVWNLAVDIPSNLDVRYRHDRRGIAISPDARKIAMIIREKESANAESEIFLQHIDEKEGIILANTKGARELAFSPDGDWIAFLARSGIKKVSTRGGPAATIFETNDVVMGLDWGEDNTIIFGVWISENHGIRRISSSGGTVELVTDCDPDSGIRHGHGHFLPDGSGFTYSISNWATRWDDCIIAARRFGDDEAKEIVKGGADGTVLPSGHIVFRRNQTLMAAPIDLDTLDLLAPAVPVLENVAGLRPIQQSRYTVSRSGSLFYVPDSGGDNMERTLNWIDLEGQATPVVPQTGNFSGPRLSADGAHVALEVEMGNESDGNIYLLELRREVLRRLTSDSAEDTDPVWSPDGKWIYFASNREGKDRTLFRIPTDFSGQAERLTDISSLQVPTDISPDGRSIAVVQRVPERQGNILLYPLDEEGNVSGEPTTLVDTPSWEWGGSFSRDGQWVAYSSADGGSTQAYVISASGEQSAIQVSKDGEINPRWSPTEDRLFLFKRGGQNVYSVPYTVEDGLFKPQLPELLFTLDSISRTYGIEVSRDGKKLLMATSASDPNVVAGSPRIIVNWLEELRSKVSVE